jgi:hypothetical protein
MSVTQHCKALPATETHQRKGETEKKERGRRRGGRRGVA